MLGKLADNLKHQRSVPSWRQACNQQAGSVCDLKEDSNRNVKGSQSTLARFFNRIFGKPSGRWDVLDFKLFRTFSFFTGLKLISLIERSGNTLGVTVGWLPLSTVKTLAKYWLNKLLCSSGFVIKCPFASLIQGMLMWLDSLLFKNLKNLQYCFPPQAWVLNLSVQVYGIPTLDCTRLIGLFWFGVLFKPPFFHIKAFWLSKCLIFWVNFLRVTKTRFGFLLDFFRGTSNWTAYDKCAKNNFQ